MADEQKPTQTTDATAVAGTKEAEAVKVDEVLTFLKDTFKREFVSREDAAKSLVNLNQMVGDQAIAELREKAKEGDNFSAVVKAYAEQEKVSLADARKSLLEDITTMSTPTHQSNPVQQTAPRQDDLVSKLVAEVESLKFQTQERDLLVSNPEAAKVLNELRGLAKVQGKSLKEAYDGSALKDLATKADAYDKKETESKSTSVDSNSRQGYDLKGDADLIDRVKKSGSEVDSVALVSKALGL